MRGTVLNKRGMYNRLKLTRLVVDSEWEERMWKEAWMPRNVTINEECKGEDREKKRKEGGGCKRKKLKLDIEEGEARGEEGYKEEEARRNFLYTTPAQRESGQGRQGTIQLLSGL